MASFKTGRVYKICFYDHASFHDLDDVEPYYCEVYGLVSGASRTRIVVQCWTTFNHDRTVCKTSTDGYVILRKDIVEAIELYE